MKKRYTIILLLFLAVLLGCPPKVVIPPTPEKPKVARPESGDALFEEAEKYYSQKKYDDALALFQQYLEQFPNQSLAAKALLRIGTIYLEFKKYGQAETVFGRLQTDYPKSPLVSDAKVAMLRIDYARGTYKKVLTEGQKLLESAIPRILVFRIYTLVGDSHMALGDVPSAVSAYSAALDVAFEDDQTAALAKLKGAINLLDIDATKVLLSQATSREPYSYLMFHLGVRQLEDEKYEAALKNLSDFITNFPNHEHARLARDMLAELEKKAVYQRHTIACLLPLSGRYKAIGQKAMRGIELAIYNFKQQNDLPDLRLVVKDTGGNNETARAAVQDLAQQKVAAIIGPIITAKAAAEEAQLHGLPIITLTQKEDITSIGDFVFRHFITPGMQVTALADYIVGDLRIKRVAILYPQDRYGQTFMHLFWDALLEKGATVAALESYDPRKTDFAEPIKKLVGLHYHLPWFLKSKITTALDRFSHDEEDPGDAFDDDAETEYDRPEAIVDFDAVFIPDSPKAAGLIIPQLLYYDIKNVYLLGTNLWHTPKFIEMAGDYIRRAIIPDVFFAHSESETVSKYVAQFKSLYGQDSGLIEAIAYDSASILLEIVNRPEVFFRNSIKETLKTLEPYNGVTGQTRFDENGEAQKSLYLLGVKRKRFFEIKVSLNSQVRAEQTSEQTY